MDKVRQATLARMDEVQRMCQKEECKVQSEKCKVALLLAMLVAGSQVHAQERAIEAGAQLVVLNVTGVTDTTQAGIGGAVAYVISDAWAIDGLVAYFPTGDNDALAGGRKVEGLAGVRAGRRWTDLGVFGKVRPGFVRYGRGTGVGVCVLIYPPPASCFGPDYRFAVDIGAIVDYRVSPRVGLRIDIGNTMVRRPAQSSWTNNLQLNAGVMFRSSGR